MKGYNFFIHMNVFVNVPSRTFPSDRDLPPFDMKMNFINEFFFLSHPYIGLVTFAVI